MPYPLSPGTDIQIQKLVDGVIDLVPLPRAYLRIRDLVNDPAASAADVAAVVQNEPAMTSRILRIANSAYLGLVSKVETVPRAVQILGLKEVHDLALAMSAVTTLHKIPCPVFDLHYFWRRAVYCAVAARIIGRRVDRAHADRAFVSGLLHDIGHLILAFRETETLQDAIASTQLGGEPLYLEERRRFGFDYADVTAAVLRRWSLPESIVEPIAWHTRPTEAPESLMLDVAIVHVGSVLARASMWRNDEDEPVPDFAPACLARLHLSEGDIEPLMAQADEDVMEVIGILLP